MSLKSKINKLEKDFNKLHRQFCCLDVGSGGGNGYTYIVENYTELLLESPLEGEFAYVKNDQGTKWLPGGLGGTYYSAGVYFYDGTKWINDNSQIALELHNDNIAFANLESTVNNHVADLSNPHQTPVDDIITNVLTEDTVNIYYRGYERNGDWEIIRYTEDDITNHTLATETNNPAYTTLTLAWASKHLLIYI